MRKVVAGLSTFLFLALLGHAATAQDMLQGRSPPDKVLYQREQRVLAKVEELFLAHVKRASNATIPHFPEEFPWKIDWDRQQAYCTGIWTALTAERQQRLRYFTHPTASVMRNGDKAIYESWAKIKFLREPFDYLYMAREGNGNNYEGAQFFDHSPDWVLTIDIPLDGLENKRSPLTKGLFIFATAPYSWGKEGNYAASVRGYSEKPPHGFDRTFSEGGVEELYVLVDGRPLRLRFGQYLPIYDKSEDELGTTKHVRIDDSYFAWFGKRRGTLGQGFVAVESHETNLYRSLALQKTGYVETGLGLAPDGDGPVLEVPWELDFQNPVCVINFDLH